MKKPTLKNNALTNPIFLRVALVAVVLGMAGCASHKPEDSSADNKAVNKGAAAKPAIAHTAPQRVFPELKKKPTDPKALLGIYDPLEPFNRSMYNFNARFDRYVFLPVVSGYKTVMPDIAEKGVTNFFNNLSELRNLTNNVLQGEMKDSGITLSRFAINTTVGVLGVWDPATRWELYEREEDFGQTLGSWGVGNGAYLVLPFFGPSSLRDTGGLVFDGSVKTSVDILGVSDKPEASLALSALESVDIRKNTKFRYYETGTPFEYSLVRYAYLRMREVQVEK